MPINWTDAEDRHLLLIMVNILTGGKPTIKWEEVAQNFGKDTTALAVSRRWKKIKEIDAESHADGGRAPAPPSTPAKATAKGKRSKNSKDHDDDDDDDDEIEDGGVKTPAKKSKSTNKGRRSAKVKEEPVDDQSSGEAMEAGFDDR